MKTLLKLSVLTLLLIITVIGCKKILQDTNGLDNEFNSAFVKNWYYTSFDKTALIGDNTKSIKKLPDWKNGVYYKMSNLQIMQFPLLKNNKEAYIPQKSTLSEADKKRVVNASLHTVVFIKDAKGIITVTELDYIPDWYYLQAKQFDISNTSIYSHNNDFTGYVIKRNWNNDKNPVYMYDYKNGKKGKALRISYNKPIVTRNPTPTFGEEEACPCMTTCETCLCLCVYYQSCELYGDGLEVCGDWQLMGCDIITAEGCNQNENPEENQQLIEFNNYAQSEQITPVTETAEVTTASTNPHIFAKTWTVAKGVLSSWNVTAITAGAYFHFKTISTITNNEIHTYDMYYFSTISTELSGANSAIATSTWTQTNSNSPDKDKVYNNNSAYVTGVAKVIGGVIHVANFSIPNPPPLPGSFTPTSYTSVNVYWTYEPK
jgi:hypothetical protein